ncbi:MAG TPA: hypothetical protein ACFCUY_00070 [Xenococcaceae cyanobacterium]|jgi:hypothetical protein
MNTEKQAREAATAKRQQEQHLQDNMLTRAEAEAKTSEQARIEATSQRQQDEHLPETMLSRSQEEIS